MNVKIKWILSCILLSGASLAYADAQSDQMNAFKNAFQEHQSIEDQRASRAAAAASAEQKKRQEVADRERAKNDAYRDEMRRLDIQERKAGIAGNRAAASRANEYIDRDLKKQDAQTDVIKSNADANRNISSGAGDMMRGIGQGASKGLPQSPAQNYNVINK